MRVLCGRVFPNDKLLCVDYYVNADSTSETASTALGIIIDNRTDELATDYSTDSNERVCVGTLPYMKIDDRIFQQQFRVFSHLFFDVVS